MKKYLQSCELGGSLYGKTKKPSKEKTDGKSEKKEDMSAYSKLYKNQLVIMNRVFKHEK